MVITEVLYSMVANKCPRCHKGKMFEINNPYNYKRGLKMNNVCSRCQLNFNPEPWYYFGAMYVSYALMVGLGVLWWIGFSLSGDYAFSIFFISLALLILAVSPLTFRWSRAIWLNFFIRYNKEYEY